MAFSATPKLIIPEEKSTSESNSNPKPQTFSRSPSSGTGTKKLTKILSTQSSFDRQHPPHPVKKRFSIDADPSSILLNPPTDLLQEASTSDSSSAILPKDLSSALKSSDSFLSIPYEKGEIVDLIKLADDPNAAAHLINDGNEVLLEHGADFH